MMEVKHIDDGRHVGDAQKKKMLSADILTDIFMSYHYCCDCWRVAQPSFIHDANCTQRLALANSPTLHPLLLQRGFENMPHDNLCTHSLSYVL